MSCEFVWHRMKLHYDRKQVSNEIPTVYPIFNRAGSVARAWRIRAYAQFEIDPTTTRRESRMYRAIENQGLRD